MKNQKDFYLTLMPIHPKADILLLRQLLQNVRGMKTRMKVLEDAIEINEEKRSKLNK